MMEQFFRNASNIYTSSYAINNKIPPKPHFVPAGDGLTKSANPTLAPLAAAALAHAKPPDPPPMTKKSYVYY